LTILCLFHLGISCTVFVLICTVVVTYCFVVCLCVCVWCVCVFYVYCTLTEVSLTLTEVFLTLTEVFPCFFLSCKANARVKLVKTGHGPHSSTLVVICVVPLLFVLFYVLFVCKCVLYCSHRVTTQLQLTSISISMNHANLSLAVSGQLQASAPSPPRRVTGTENI